MASAVFPLRFGTLRIVLSAIGTGPAFSRVTVDDDEVRVVMGWAFRARIPRDSIVGAHADSGPVGGIGVHGSSGGWLVNGASTGLVRLAIDPPARARVTGMPVELRLLRVSMEDPAALLAALAG